MNELLKSNSLFELVLNVYEATLPIQLHHVSQDEKGLLFSAELQKINYGKSIYSFKELMAFLSNVILDQQHYYRLLKYLDNYYYKYDNYMELFNNKKCIEFKNSNYILVINPINSLTSYIDKNFKKGLRLSRTEMSSMQPLSMLKIKHFAILPNIKKFNIKTRFIEKDEVASHISNGIFNINCVHLINCESIHTNPLKTNPVEFVKIDYLKNGAFYACNYEMDKKLKENYKSWYFASLENALKQFNDFIVLPEMSNTPYIKGELSNTIKNTSIKNETIIVAGSCWENNASTIYVYDEKGELLLKNKKYIPYIFYNDDDKDNPILEALDYDNPHDINLLFIKDSGLYAFFVCSDLTDSEYLNYVLDAKVSNIMMCSFSASHDIFSGLRIATEHYLVSSFACNVCLNENGALDTIVLIPYIDKDNKRTIFEPGIAHCDKQCINKGDCCYGSRVSLNLEATLKRDNMFYEEKNEKDDA